ncbi:MAG: DNA polymerase [Bacilli bacterium]
MINCNWKLITIEKESDLSIIWKKTKELKPDLLTIDTETNGLHIIRNKPFYIPFGVCNSETKQAIGFILKTTIDCSLLKDTILKIGLKVKKIIFWNAKFDLHMLYNIGINLTTYSNITDAMIYARLALDAKAPSVGGPVLKLKIMAKKYIDPSARTHEREVAMEKKNILHKRNMLIKAQGYTIKQINEIENNKLNETVLPPKILNILNDPKNNPNDYSNVSSKILEKYGIYDVIYTTELFLYFRNIVIERKQMDIAIIEEKNIRILWNMERLGMRLNKEYLRESKENVRNYILEKRIELKEIVHSDMSCNQHAMIKKFISQTYHYDLLCSDNDALSILNKETHEKELKNLIDIILELRSLEKWYSTYICRFEEDNDITYTSFNQVGAVSGRFSSNFQQFPKEPIYKTSDNTMLFSPRKLIQVKSENYPYLVYMDYSSEELRFQALYTILIGEPDINLCRAYIPYNCYRLLQITNDKVLYNYEKDFEQYTWFKNEDDIEWHKTDLHTHTAHEAFPEIKETDANFGHYRKLAKCTNFACNYGANKNTLIKKFHYTDEVATKLYTAYLKTFKGVAAYKKYVDNVLYKQNYITNLFGRRYYNEQAHKCCNYLIQGSGADFLKLKLIKIDKFLRENNYKSYPVCLIHDEIVYQIHKDELHILPQLKEIMESFEESKIPMIAEIEITTTSWDEKHEYKPD